MKYGILGGTFNPVHNGHLAVAETVYKKLRLDKVILAPAYHPPHKGNEEIIPFQQRWDMLKLATAPYQFIQLSDLDFTPGEKSYTKQLIEKLRKRHLEATFYFIIGADNIPQLPTWHKYRWLLENVNFVAVPRNDYHIDDFSHLDYIDKIIFLDMIPVNISSRVIRKKLAAGEDISDLTPAPVEEYIKSKGLYRKG